MKKIVKNDRNAEKRAEERKNRGRKPGEPLSVKDAPVFETFRLSQEHRELEWIQTFTYGLFPNPGKWAQNGAPETFISPEAMLDICPDPYVIGVTDKGKLYIIQATAGNITELASGTIFKLGDADAEIQLTWAFLVPGAAIVRIDNAEGFPLEVEYSDYPLCGEEEAETATVAASGDFGSLQTAFDALG